MFVAKKMLIFFFFLILFQVFLAVELPLGIITILHTVSSTVYDFLDYKIVKSTILVRSKAFPTK